MNQNRREMKNNILELQLIENGFNKRELPSGIIVYDKGDFRIEKIQNIFITESLLKFETIDEVLVVEKIKNKYKQPSPLDWRF